MAWRARRRFKPAHARELLVRANPSSAWPRNAGGWLEHSDRVGWSNACSFVCVQLTLKPLERRQALCASMYSAQCSSPFSTTQVSLGLRVSGQAQQIFSFGFSSAATAAGVSEAGISGRLEEVEPSRAVSALHKNNIKIGTIPYALLFTPRHARVTPAALRDERWARPVAGSGQDGREAADVLHEARPRSAPPAHRAAARVDDAGRAAHERAQSQGLLRPVHGRDDRAAALGGLLRVRAQAGPADARAVRAGAARGQCAAAAVPDVRGRRRLHQLQGGPCQGRADRPCRDVPGRAAADPRPLPPQLPAAGHEEPPAGHGVRVRGRRR
eukprot:scaffold4022_cov122-Isochrysis_galbana.AAC.15